MKIQTAHGWYMQQREKGWYKWFAWYPVEIENDEEVWLEWIERRITGLADSSKTSTATYEYRILEVGLQDK